MTTDENNQDVSANDKGAGEGAQKAEGTTISLSREEYDALMLERATLGTTKRELKDARKALEDSQKAKETPEKNQPDSSLLQKSFLRAAGITDAEEVDLALKTAKKWGVEVDVLVDDEDFKVKLEKIRTQKSNERATSGVSGGQGSSQSKQTAEHWIQKGEYPSREQLPDRKERAKVAKAMMDSARPKAKFYNE